MANVGLKYTTQDMHELAKSRGFSFLSDHYKGIATKHLWKCKQGHIWKAKPCAIKSGTGCKKCSSAQLRTSIEDANRIAKIRGFELVSTEYRGMTRKHIWECPDGHTWRATPQSIKSGSGCPKCQKLSEEKVRFIFESFTQKQFFTNRTILSGLKLDGYCEKLKVAFEYQGKQHYDPQSHFHRTSNSFKDLMKRDRQKVKECEKLGIALLIIPYTESSDYRNLEHFIRDFLKPFGFTIFSVDWSKFESSRSKLNKLIKICEERKMKLNTKAYLGSESKHSFQCLKCGHNWRTVAKYILKNGVLVQSVLDVKNTPENRYVT